MLFAAGFPRVNYWWCRFVAAATVLASMAIAVPTKPISDRGGGEMVANVHARDSRAANPRVDIVTLDEGLLIQPIDIPFVQEEGGWERPGNGISMCSLGEPKSGTTWTERVITELVLQLCGSSTNTWCQMGGLVVIPNRPDPSYIWEMLHADTGELFLRFDGRTKHVIPGLQVRRRCNPRGRSHPNRFALASACREDTTEIKQESLLQCMPNTSERCAKLMPSRDPSVRRTAVVFRDPRDVVISERRMKLEVYHAKHAGMSLTTFIEHRFKTIVSWQFVRWMWHTTFYKNESHVMFYEDLQENPENLEDLAAFMGLKCSREQAFDVWERHRNQSPHGNFNMYNLPVETIEMMNATMVNLLPKAMLDRYGLSELSSGNGSSYSAGIGSL